LKLSIAGGGKKVEVDPKKAKVEEKKRGQEETAALAKVEPDNEEIKSNKLIVKNLAFETTEAEIRELFKAYGAVKKVRLPKKVNSKSHRGFGFVEFVSSEEAKGAFQSLQHTHLYGRKLIIEWSKPEDDTLMGKPAPQITHQRKPEEPPKQQQLPNKRQKFD
jgi:multiple RNA-binding domain-containing protein 1